MHFFRAAPSVASATRRATASMYWRRNTGNPHAPASIVTRSNPPRARAFCRVRAGWKSESHRLSDSDQTPRPRCPTVRKPSGTHGADVEAGFVSPPSMGVPSRPRMSVTVEKQGAAPRKCASQGARGSFRMCGNRKTHSAIRAIVAQTAREHCRRITVRGVDLGSSHMPCRRSLISDLRSAATPDSPRPRHCAPQSLFVDQPVSRGPRPSPRDHPPTARLPIQFAPAANGATEVSHAERCHRCRE